MTCFKFNMNLILMPGLSDFDTNWWPTNSSMSFGCRLLRCHHPNVANISAVNFLVVPVCVMFVFGGVPLDALLHWEVLEQQQLCSSSKLCARAAEWNDISRRTTRRTHWATSPTPNIVCFNENVGCMFASCSPRLLCFLSGFIVYVLIRWVCMLGIQRFRSTYSEFNACRNTDRFVHFGRVSWV